MFDQAKATENYIDLKFTQTPKYASLTDDKFRVFQTDVAPEVELVEVFEPLNLERDYNDLSRALRLWFRSAHDNTHTYRLEVSGLVNVANRDMGTGTFEYTREPASITDPDDPPYYPAPDPMPVIDKSIIPNVFALVTTSTQVQGKNFYLVSSDPEENELFVDNDHNNGRITLNFSQRPAVQYLTNEYFKVQRKQIGVAGRWEKVDAQITLDSSRSRVYIYTPSLDDIPVYDETGRDYFESGYKYRLKISNEVGT